MKRLKAVYFIVAILPSSTLAMNPFSQERNFSFENKNSIHKLNKIVNKTKKDKRPENDNFNEIEWNKENKNKEEENIERQSFKRRKFSGSPQNELGNSKDSLFQSELRNITKKIEDNREAADWVAMYKTFLSFHSLQYDDLAWQSLARELKAYKWPSQKSWKDVVGGHIFFPHETIEWETNTFESFHLRRIDMIWSFAIGAKFHHALSKYYLANVLDTIRSDYTDLPSPPFFEKLYREAFADFKKSSNADACYIIGINYGRYPYLSTTYIDTKEERDISNSQKAIDWHEKGADLKNKFEILEVKAATTAIYATPTAQEYLALAREGYISAYLDAYCLTNDSQESKEIEQEALEKGYKYFFPAIRFPCKNAEILKIAREAYSKAGAQKLSHAYILLGSTYVDKIFLQFKLDRINLKKIPSQDIKAAIEAFTAAGNLKNPEGWEYLSTLYQELYEQKVIKEEEYREKIVYVLEEGVKLGSAACYSRTKRYLPDPYMGCFVDNYGYPPQADLYSNIERFLNKKY